MPLVQSDADVAGKKQQYESIARRRVVFAVATERAMAMMMVVVVETPRECNNSGDYFPEPRYRSLAETFRVNRAPPPPPPRCVSIRGLKRLADRRTVTERSRLFF